jgi:5-methylcytosine-specific restriction endonuclease McrA
MGRLRQKAPRLRLDLIKYRLLREQVLERDGWRCQICGSFKNLQAHHTKSRSKLGNDSELNLITLCADCHRSMHEMR